MRERERVHVCEGRRLRGVHILERCWHSNTGVCVCLYLYVCVCLCEYVSVCDGKRLREVASRQDIGIQILVCVCVCVCERESV